MPLFALFSGTFTVYIRFIIIVWLKQIQLINMYPALWNFGIHNNTFMSSRLQVHLNQTQQKILYFPLWYLP